AGIGRRWDSGTLTVVPGRSALVAGHGPRRSSDEVHDRMKSRSIMSAAICVALLAHSGCNGVLSNVLRSQTTVLLINNANADVDVNVADSDDSHVFQDVLDHFGTMSEFTLSPGQSTSLTRSCDDLKAVEIEDAQLRVFFGSGPHTHSSVYRAGTDFDCGQTITFTFSGSATDFRVTAAVK